MPEPTPWVHARIEWGSTLDVVTNTLSKPAGAEHLVTWPATEFETTDTDCFTLDGQIWIWQREVGAVRFSLSAPTIAAFPWPGSDPDKFRQLVMRAWLPAIYPLWGRQVLHASAVTCAATGDVVAFTGPTHAGKSTTAYGLGRRPGWRLISDDTLSFSLSAGTPGRPGTSTTPATPPTSASNGIVLHPIPGDSRLRPTSADYYGVSDRPQTTLEWPDAELRLKALYILEGDETFPQPATFARLRAADALPLLLQQAYALSFEIPKYNQQLMKDYLALATVVPVFRLRYRRRFDVAEALFSAIAAHLVAEVGVACTSDPVQA